MTAAPLPDDFAGNARWLVQALDPRSRLVRLVGIDAAQLREASFLDDRMNPATFDHRLCSLDDAMAESAAIERDDARWIFHIGHVGSTLVARLLGEIEGVVSLREPRSLRDLAAADPAERPAIARALRRMMARGFAPSDKALVKATSFVSEMAPLLVAPQRRALFLYASLRDYVAGILAGENSVRELHALALVRAQRLAARGIALDLGQNDAALAAVAWACEMTSLEAAAEQMTDRSILWKPFDPMLADMTSALAQLAEFFRFDAAPARFAEIAGGPLMRRYSKAMEFDYSPALRAELLAEAGAAHRSDIDAAEVALRKAGEEYPLLARALNRSDGEG